MPTKNRSRLAWLVAAAATSLAAQASAQAPAQAPAAASDDARSEARASFARGEDAFAQGDPRAALAHFERAFELVAHDAVRFNIAVCLEALGRNAEALDQYRAAAASGVLSAEERARAERAARVASSRVGSVRIDSAGGRGGGAQVTVDGRPRCLAPCRIEVDPGGHDVVVATSPSPHRVRVDARAGEEIVVKPDTPSPTGVAPMLPPTTTRSTFEPGWLTWAGAAVGVVGVAGVVGFGLRAESLHDDYEREPTRDRLEDGESARNLANVAIGVAAVGAVLVAIDLVFLAPREARPAPRTAQLVW